MTTTAELETAPGVWWSRWRVPMGLVVLSLVPAMAGSVRVAQLAAGVAVTEDNRRFVEAPFPVILHVVAVVIFAFAGALQFAAPLRRRRRSWHRRAGCTVVPAGVVVALSGIWMTARYDLPRSDNAVLAVVRYLVGTWMVIALVAGVTSLRAGRYRSHGKWMARAYGVGLGAGTQVFTNVVWIVAVGKPSPMIRAGLMTAGWAINIAVVEWAFRRDNDPRGGGLARTTA